MATDLLTADTIKRSPCEIATDADSGAALLSTSIGVESVAEGQGSAGAFPASMACEPVRLRSFSQICSDYLQLTKPRIVVMILVTTIATATIGAGGGVSAAEMCWLLIGTAAVAASAGAANQIWERGIDQRMTRTAQRPLPDGRLQSGPAIAYTALLGLGGSALLWSQFGSSPALAGIGTWLLYVLVYTPMKTRTAWNTTVGAIAGAIPMLIGYTATGGSLLDWTGWLLVGVLVAWQYPHFMAIAWMYRRQYSEAGFQMTTTVEPTGRSAAWQSIAGSIALMVCGVSLCFVSDVSIRSMLASTGVLACSMPMLRASFRFASQRDDLSARTLLRSSLLVLPTVLAIVTLRVFW